MYLFIKVTTVAGFSIFTSRNKVVAKVIFLHLSVIHSVHGGMGSASVHARIPPPKEQTPQSRHPHHCPLEQRPPRADTPPRSRDTPGADTPPEQTPGSRHPPRKQTPSYDLRAAGMHPTGMHSCYPCNS